MQPHNCLHTNLCKFKIQNLLNKIVNAKELPPLKYSTCKYTKTHTHKHTQKTVEMQKKKQLKVIKLEWENRGKHPKKRTRKNKRRLQLSLTSFPEQKFPIAFPYIYASVMNTATLYEWTLPSNLCNNIRKEFMNINWIQQTLFERDFFTSSNLSS